MNCTLIERNTKKGFKFRVKERPKVGFMRREVFFFFFPSHIFTHISPSPPISVTKRQLPCLRLSTLHFIYNYIYNYTTDVYITYIY